jgi:hypothetical protein
MRSPSRRSIAALALTLGLAAAAFVSSQAAEAGSGARAKGGLLEAAANYIGIERRVLVGELRAGRSLAQSAAAHGKTRAGLKDALLDVIAARVNARTDLTAERKAQILTRASERVDRLIDRTGLRKRHRGKAGNGLLRAAAAYIGVGPRVLAAELRAGASLAESARAHGKSREGLKAALLDALKARLDRSVRLTAEQKSAALARAAARIDKLIDRKRST